MIVTEMMAELVFLAHYLGAVSSHSKLSGLTNIVSY
jgi:hypothetical protein